MTPDKTILDNDIQHLTERVVDLGVYIEELFKNAVSLLFSREWSSVHAIFQSAPDVAPVTLSGEAMRIIQRWAPIGEQLGAVLALQQAANEFGVIYDIIVRIAEKARALDDDVESYLQLMGPEGRQAFYTVIQSAYIQLRGGIVALNTRQASIAAHVIAQDSVLDHAYLVVQAASAPLLNDDLSARARPVTLLRVIVGDIEQLGNHVTRICAPIEQPMLFPASDGDLSFFKAG